MTISDRFYCISALTQANLTLMFVCASAQSDQCLCSSFLESIITPLRERSGSMVECLTGDQEAAGSSLTGVTALLSLSKTHLSNLSTGSTMEDPSLFN